MPPTGTSPTATNFSPRSARRPWVSSPSPSSARAWPNHRDLNSVAKLRDQPVVIGYLVLVGRADAEQRAADRVSDTMAPRPGGEDVVEAPVGVQADRGQGIAVGPGVAGRAVSRHLPAVVEQQPGTRGGGTAGEHPDLVGIGPGVEIAADDDEIALRSDLADQGRQLSHLGLADAAAIERVTEHHREQLDWPAVAVHGDVNNLPITRAVLRAQLAAPWLAHGPPADQADPRHPVLLLPVAREVAVRQSEPARDLRGLARFTPAPGFNQADHVGFDFGEGVLQGGLPGFPPGPVASPDVPRDDPDRRLDHRPIRGIGIKAHVVSIAAHAVTSPSPPSDS